MSKLLQDLLKVVQPINYRGVMIYPSENGKFKVMGKEVDTLLHAKSEIDVAYDKLSESVLRGKKCQ